MRRGWGDPPLFLLAASIECRCRHHGHRGDRRPSRRRQKPKNGRRQTVSRCRGSRRFLNEDSTCFAQSFRKYWSSLRRTALRLVSMSELCRDLVPDCGSLGGLYTGLTQAATPCIFVVACDMPFLNQAVIAQFTSRRASADIVMAKLAARLHPMHALYGKRLPACLGTDDSGTTAQDSRAGIARVPSCGVCHRGGSVHHRSLRALFSKREHTGGS